ncbi:MAG: hypothetical protein ABS889_08685, partial [Desemzia incerta]
TFLGLVITGSVCNLFLNFKNDNENFILFIVLLIASVLNSYLVDFLFSEYCGQIEPPVRSLEPVSARHGANQCGRKGH